MQRSTGCLVLACLAILLPLGASAAGNLSVFLKNYYTDYAIVVDCSGKSHLSPADAEAAKSAIAKIEKVRKGESGEDVALPPDPAGRELDLR